MLNVKLASTADLDSISYTVSDQLTTIVTSTVGEDDVTYECDFTVDNTNSNYVEFSNIPYGTTFEVKDATTSAGTYENEYAFTGTSCHNIEIESEDIIIGVGGTVQENTQNPTVTVTAIYDFE